MSILFQNEILFNKIKVSKCSSIFSNLCFTHSDTWMCLSDGEGEKEIDYHGRSEVKSFSQGTIDRIGYHHGLMKLSAKKEIQVQEARETLTQLPFFFFSNVRFGKFSSITTRNESELL